MTDKDAEIAALKAEVERLAADKTITVDIGGAFAALQSSPDLAQMMNDLVNGDPLNAAIARAEAAEARVAELEADNKAYEEAVSRAEKTFRKNKSRSWVLQCIRTRLQDARALLNQDKTNG